MYVWALQSGEAHQGGRIIGLYMTKQDARADFTRAARDMDVTVGEDAWEGHGPVRVRDDCDWLALESVEVKGDPQALPNRVCPHCDTVQTHCSFCRVDMEP